MNINANEVLKLRDKGLTMWDISYKIAQKNHDLAHMENRECRKIIEEYLYSEGGVFDIIMDNPEGYDIDGIKNLAIGVIKNAVNEYGRLYTRVMHMTAPLISWKRACELYAKAVADEKDELADEYNNMITWYECHQKMETLEKFFNNNCNGWMDYFENDISAKAIIENAKNDALDGRWIKFNLMHFNTREEAEIHQILYPYCKEYYRIVHHIKDDTYGFEKKEIIV